MDYCTTRYCAKATLPVESEILYAYVIYAYVRLVMHTLVVHMCPIQAPRSCCRSCATVEMFLVDMVQKKLYIYTKAG